MIKVKHNFNYSWPHLQTYRQNFTSERNQGKLPWQWKGPACPSENYFTTTISHFSRQKNSKESNEKHFNVHGIAVIPPKFARCIVYSLQTWLPTHFIALDSKLLIRNNKWYIIIRWIQIPVIILYLKAVFLNLIRFSILILWFKIKQIYIHRINY